MATGSDALPPSARVAELADAQDLGSCAARREGSSPSSRISSLPVSFPSGPPWRGLPTPSPRRRGPWHDSSRRACEQRATCGWSGPRSSRRSPSLVSGGRAPPHSCLAWRAAPPASRLVATSGWSAARFFCRISSALFRSGSASAYLPRLDVEVSEVVEGRGEVERLPVRRLLPDG